MGRLDGKVALVTGAARSLGRSHAVRMAEEGASIVAVDICAPIDGVRIYPPATEDDLAETVNQVEALDQRIVAHRADVRDPAALKAAVDDGVKELGRLDAVVCNAGVFDIAPWAEVSDQSWKDIIDINLTGVWNTCRAAIPHVQAGGNGGAIVIISSTAGLQSGGYIAPYAASKHAVVGLMRTLANELAPDFIRVSTVHPTQADTVMIQNEATYGLLQPDADPPTKEGAAEVFTTMNALPVPWVDPADVSHAVVYLCSDEARYVTGATLTVDAGFTVK